MRRDGTRDPDLPLSFFDRFACASPGFSAAGLGLLFRLLARTGGMRGKNIMFS